MSTWSGSAGACKRWSPSGSRQHSRRLAAPFADYLLGLPETLALFNITGPDDYLLHVAVPDTQHLRAFVLDRLGERDEIAHLHTSLIFEHQSKAAITPLTSHTGGGPGR
jgi:DNA-binding Lrp family transcriptional regulator